MPPRERLRVAWGEGLDRESGMMLVRPNTFSDLRNWLLHEGRLVLRPGYAARGTGEFGEVDRLVAGHAIRNEGLGIVVGYSSSTERVWVYRVAADLSLVELLAEWEHDLASGWGSATPRIIMTEVNGRIFLAHDEGLVTRRAPTMVYDPVTGSQLLDVLRAAFAGTTTTNESGESGESQAEVDAVRFRGVVRHLAYLVGWGFGTATQARPELVRVSLPDDPRQFDPDHYFIAGDRRDPVLACGPSGSGPQGTVLNVWKRTEAHGIFGYDRRSFGIQLIDPRHGIVSSRAWLNLEGVAIAWAEEGPRLWTGLGASEALELPLGLDEWEPSDLVDEGELGDAFCQYVPRERVGMFCFGRRVYALTARVRGRWRWSYHALGFQPYGAMTFYEPAEAQLKPPGFPEFVDADPAGTYADIDVEHHNHDGDETLEVWLQPVVAQSGGVDSPAPGVFRGATSFSEFAVASGVPAGITPYAHAAAAPGDFTVAIGDDPIEGHYLGVTPTQFTAPWAFGVDSFDAVMEHGEILARVWIPTAVSNREAMGSVMAMRGATVAAAEGRAINLFMRSTGDFESQATTRASGFTSIPLAADLQEAEQVDAWAWQRYRATLNPLFSPNTDVRVKTWYGALVDEPAGWDGERLNVPSTGLTGVGAVGAGMLASRPLLSVQHRMAFLSFTTDPDHPPLTPGDISTQEAPWFLASSVAASPSALQTVRVEDLEVGQEYNVALRYRRGLQFNAGAEDESDPSKWPSVSQGSFTTTADPPAILAATWSRTDAASEQIALDIRPVVGLEAEDIEVFRRTFSGSATSIGTINGPHVGDVQFVDSTVSGETAYFYSVRTKTSTPGALGPETRAWAGPPAVPQYVYQTAGHSGYVLGFTPGDVTLETELHDNYDDAGGTGPFALRATADAGDTEVFSGQLQNVPAGTFQLEAKIRHKATTFGIDDFGEFDLPNQTVFLPEEN